MKHHRFLVAMVSVALALCACSGGPPEPEATGCASPAHAGLACVLSTAPEQVGVCADEACSPLPCEVADDCNDRSGHDACRLHECVKASPSDFTGVCEMSPTSEGFACSMPSGGTGACTSGSCI